MTIVTLFLYVALAAAALSLVIYRFKKDGYSLIDNFIQNFAGILFIFSGFVKAVDPMGTAFKMEQYFTAFEDTCNGSFLNFLAPLFPMMTKLSLGFSVFMIVLEIVLGVMIIIGYRRKLAAWLFFIIMIFFTILTGFTYLTGYVPTEANFFEFSKWTEFNKNQMRVTDCGCFGDFIKLEPKISFIKDLILMVPAIWFLIRWNKLYMLFTEKLRASITSMSVIGLLLFCFSNYIWNEPIIDFRPFAIGVDIKSQLEAEQKAQADVEILAYKIRNRETKKEFEVPYKDYLDSFKANSNFKASWETLDQIKSEPAIPRTKISDFDIMSFDGESKTQEILNDTRYTLIIISPKVKNKVVSEEVNLKDTLYHVDTIVTFDPSTLVESISIVKNRIDTIVDKTIKRNAYTWDPGFINIVQSKILPLLDSVKNEQLSVMGVFGGLTEEGIIELRKASGIYFSCYEADDLLLKTIMRSNPGVLLLKEGKIIHKWHHSKLPEAKDLRLKYLNAVGNKIY